LIVIDQFEICTSHNLHLHPFYFCHDLNSIKVNHAKYSSISRTIRTLMFLFNPDIYIYNL